MAESSDMGSAFIKIEDKFEKRFGSTTKLSCCGKEIELRLACQIIGVLVVLEAIMKFGTTFARWGAPCFHWESYTATVVTFVSAHFVRLVGLALGVWVILSLRADKNAERATSVLFQYLVALSAVCALDLFICLFEVHDVCHSTEIVNFNQCAHTWGIQAHVCEAKTTLPVDQQVCAAASDNLKRNEAAVDKVAYKEKQKEDYIIPACCTDEIWDGKFSPCGSPLGSRLPAERPATFDSTWCEEISDLYDVGLGLVCTAIVIGMAYVVHSFRVEAKGVEAN